MGRISIFVDAGYLYKQGSGAVLNEKLGRHDVSLDADKFVTELVKWVCGLYLSDEVLRTYWYDGAKQGVPTTDQLNVASVAFVKLRLGRINSAGQQKGVDTLIVRDLMVLSQERSIHRAIVLSGDEDLREGIEYAQDRGVHVAVVGIDVNGDLSQSVELVREADESLVLPQPMIKDSLTRRVPVTHQQVPPSGIVATLQHETVASPSNDGFAELAQQFARQWIAKARPEEITALLNNRPSIPRELDGQLLSHAVRGSGVHTIDDDSRRGMRVAFWKTVGKAAN